MDYRIALFAAVFVAAIGSAAGAPAPCDQTCTAIKEVMRARAANFTALKGDLAAKEDPDDSDAWRSKVVPPGLQACSIMSATDAPAGTNQYSCHLWGAPKAAAQAEFASLVAAFRALVPGWKWFSASDPRFPQNPNSVEIFGGPARGGYIADLWLGDKGETFDVILKITAKPHGLPSLRVAPYKFPKP